MKRALAIVAVVASLWPLPIGLGYLFLRQWGRFVLALLACTIGQSLLAQVIGRMPAAAVVAVLWVLTILDTIRIAAPQARRTA